jgi:hypothetical protein
VKRKNYESRHCAVFSMSDKEKWLSSQLVHAACFNIACSKKVHASKRESVHQQLAKNITTAAEGWG